MTHGSLPGGCHGNKADKVFGSRGCYDRLEETINPTVTMTTYKMRCVFGRRGDILKETIRLVFVDISLAHTGHRQDTQYTPDWRPDHSDNLHTCHIDTHQSLLNWVSLRSPILVP